MLDYAISFGNYCSSRIAATTAYTFLLERNPFTNTAFMNDGNLFPYLPYTMHNIIKTIL